MQSSALDQFLIFLREGVVRKPYLYLRRCFLLRLEQIAYQVRELSSGSSFILLACNFSITFICSISLTLWRLAGKCSHTRVNGSLPFFLWAFHLTWERVQKLPQLAVWWKWLFYRVSYYLRLRWTHHKKRVAVLFQAFFVLVFFPSPCYISNQLWPPIISPTPQRHFFPHLMRKRKKQLAGRC